MLKVSGLCYSYEGGGSALKNLNFGIEKGEFVGITGESGAGKTTLAFALGGIIPQRLGGEFTGNITIRGMDTANASPERLAMTVGSVFQDVDAQLTATIVEDELLFGLENFGVERSEIEPRVAKTLETLGISELRYREISSLSGGQKQKVAIAAALALQPEALVLDEPTGELDPQSSRQIFEALRELNKTRGMTVVIVEQKMALLCEFAQKLLILKDGELKLFGTVREVLSRGEELQACGVSCPKYAELARELSLRGWYGGETPINLDEAEIMANGALYGCI